MISEEEYNSAVRTIIVNSERFSKGDGWLRQEFMEAGYNGMLRAIRNYDESRGLKFNTYCAHKTLGAMNDEKDRLYGRCGIAKALPEIQHRDKRSAEMQELKDILHKIDEQLSIPVFKHMLLGYTQVEIAKMYSVSTGTVTNIKKKGIKIARERKIL